MQFVSFWQAIQIDSYGELLCERQRGESLGRPFVSPESASGIVRRYCLIVDEMSESSFFFELITQIIRVKVRPGIRFDKFEIRF